jgi:hypothetical protein
MSFGDAARSLRPAAGLALDLLDAAAGIVDTAPGVGEPAEILAHYDQPIDELLVPAAALAAYCDAEDLRHLGVAFGLLAAATSERYQQRTQVMDVLLARAVRIVSAVALAHDRPEALLPVASICHNDESLLTSRSLRHLDLYRDGADTAHTAHVQWLLARPWRAEIAPLRADEQVSIAMAEVDVLLACLQAAAGRETYAPGLLIGEAKVRPRLAARMVDPRQRAAMTNLFATTDAELDECASSAYGRLVANSPDGFPARRQALFGE